MNNLLDKISPSEALEILKLLAKTDTQTKKKILDIAENMIKDIDYDSICDDVFWALDGIDVHELWNSSGSTVDGYISTDQMAVEMIEEELEPFQQEIFRLIKLGLSQENNRSSQPRRRRRSAAAPHGASVSCDHPVGWVF